MADQYKTGSIYPIEPNPILDKTSRGLSALRKYLNMTGKSVVNAIPFSDERNTLPVGSLLTGKAPEEIGKWAYGFDPFTIQPSQMRLNQLAAQGVRPDRQEGVIDVGMLPFTEAAGLATLTTKGTGKLARRAAEQALGGETSLGRRKFLQNAGAATAGATVAVPALLRGLGKDAEKVGARAAEEDVAKMAGKAAEKIKLTPHQYHGQRALIDVQAREAGLDAADAMMKDPEYAYKDTDKKEQYHMWEGTYEDAYQAEKQRLLDELHNKVEPHPAEWELTRDLHASEHSPEGEAAYIKGHLDQGWLPNSDSWISSRNPQLETVQQRVRSGGSYTNPFTGNRAILDEHGDVVWTSGIKDSSSPTGYRTARHEHWLGANNHKLKAREQLGLIDSRLNYIGPKRMERPSNPYEYEPEPDLEDYFTEEYDGKRRGVFKRGGSIERTTHDRKIL